MKHKIIALLTLTAIVCAPSAFGMSGSASAVDSKEAASSMNGSGSTATTSDKSCGTIQSSDDCIKVATKAAEKGEESFNDLWSDNFYCPTRKLLFGYPPRLSTDSFNAIAPLIDKWVKTLSQRQRSIILKELYLNMTCEELCERGEWPVWLVTQRAKELNAEYKKESRGNFVVPVDPTAAHTKILSLISQLLPTQVKQRTRTNALTIEEWEFINSGVSSLIQTQSLITAAEEFTIINQELLKYFWVRLNHDWGNRHEEDGCTIC